MPDRDMRVDLANERKSAAVAEVVSDEPVFVDQILLGQKEHSTELSDLGLPEIQELDLLT